MYPLAVILPIAAARRDHGARWYVIPIAAIGAGVSIYHYVLEWAPELEGGSCSATGPRCSAIWFREFGFVTLASMALAGFVSIILLVTVSARFPGTTPRIPPPDVHQPDVLPPDVRSPDLLPNDEESS
jgi:disulfide bond formation protein DsbB